MTNVNFISVTNLPETDTEKVEVLCVDNGELKRKPADGLGGGKVELIELETRTEYPGEYVFDDISKIQTVFNDNMSISFVNSQLACGNLRIYPSTIPYIKEIMPINDDDGEVIGMITIMDQNNNAITLRITFDSDAYADGVMIAKHAIFTLPEYYTVNKVYAKPF